MTVRVDWSLAPFWVRFTEHLAIYFGKTERGWTEFVGTAKPTQSNFMGSVEEVGDWQDLKSTRAEMDQIILDRASHLINEMLARDLS